MVAKKTNHKKSKRTAKNKKKTVRNYVHKENRLNNPHVGISVKNIDSTQQEKTTYEIPKVLPHDPKHNPNPETGYDPDNDRHLSPILMWAGKYDKKEIVVDVLPLHVHERIDPHSIIQKISKRGLQLQMDSFFDREENVLEISKELQFYQHKNGWSNRIISGDSMLVMNSLLTKERMAGSVQMIYIDPPYGINYGSNFQPYVCQNSVDKDDKDVDLTEEAEMIRAFRDTWEHGIHSYLTSLRNRLLLAKKLLRDTGSCFVQISAENVHLVRVIMEEIFGKDNFMALISYRTKSPLGAKYMPRIVDYIIWYSKNKSCVT